MNIEPPADHPPIGLGDARATPPEILQALKRLGARIALNKGADLFCQGDTADALYVLSAGTLEVSILSADGRKLTLNHMKPGTIFGEIALFDGGLRTATVTALERCEILGIDRRALLAEIRANPDFAVGMIRLCVDRLRWVDAQLNDHVFQPLGVRLARRLLFLLGREGQGNVVPLSQGELASHVGVTREAVAKVLAEWKAAGFVAPGRGKIAIRDVAALRDLAEAGRN